MPLSGSRELGEWQGVWAEAAKIAGQSHKAKTDIAKKAAYARIERRSTDSSQIRRNLKKIARLKKRADRLKARVRKIKTRGLRFIGIPLGKGKNTIARLKRRITAIDGRIVSLEAEVQGLKDKAVIEATRAGVNVKGDQAPETEEQAPVAVKASGTEAEGAKQKMILFGSIAAVAGAVLIAVLLKSRKSADEKETVKFRPAPHGVRGAQ